MPSPESIPGFDRDVANDGYAWWYVDALSDDGRHGLTLIAMLGCVFSPYYAAARRRGSADPLEHCAMNVALYGAVGRRWAMTERPANRLERTASSLTIGPSSMRWHADGLHIDIDERTAPIPRALRGRIRVRPDALVDRSFTLDVAGRHRWRPLAPRARVEVEFTDPALAWQGDGYLDSNDGDRPLENDFVGWTWSRGTRKAGTRRTTVLYDVVRSNQEEFGLALDFGHDGSVTPIDAPPVARLPSSMWRVPRSTRSDVGYGPRVSETLEDGPFYARSVIETRIQGAPVTAVHESVSLRRFASRWVQALLPVRMPRSSR